MHPDLIHALVRARLQEVARDAAGNRPPPRAKQPSRLRKHAGWWLIGAGIRLVSGRAS